MPLLGPGRAFFRVRVVEKDESAIRFHSHCGVEEYYLILGGKGTLRYNGKETEVTPGDLISKPAGAGGRFAANGFQSPDRETIAPEY